MTNLLRAELLKLGTTRTAWGMLLATLGLTALAVTSAVIVGANANLEIESPDGVRSILSVITSGGIFVLVLGIIISSGEYRHRTATDTFLTTPRRWRVIAAKLLTAGAAGLVFGALSAAVAIGVASVAYRIEDLTFAFGATDAWASLAGAVFYGALFGAIGAATGSLVRNQVVAIVGWLVWIAVFEHIATGFAPDVGRWLPVSAGRALVGSSQGELLSPVAAGYLLAIYALAIVGAAVFSERFRDA